MRTQVDAAVNELKAKLGDDLRGVFWGNFPEHDYTQAYLPAGAEEASPALILELLEYLTSQQMPAGMSNLQVSDELAAALGDFQLSVRIFTNRALCLAWNPHESMGIIVGTTADADLNFVGQTIIAAVSNQLGERIN